MQFSLESRCSLVVSCENEGFEIDSYYREDIVMAPVFNT